MNKKIINICCTTMLLSTLSILPQASAANNNISTIEKTPTQKDFNPRESAEQTTLETIRFHNRDRSEDLLTFWIAPDWECDKENSDGSEDHPYCDIGQVNAKLYELYDQGKARGDIDVRFKTGKDNNGKERIYGPEPEQSEREAQWTFAPGPGAVVRFIPDWYDNIEDNKNNNVNNYIKYYGKKKGTNNNTESIVGLNIYPIQNKGGSFQISGFDFQNFINPIKLIGGVHSEEHFDNDEYTSNPYNGVKHGRNAAINHALIQNNRFKNIGSKHTDHDLKDNISASIRPWNTSNLVIDNNQFINNEALNEGPNNTGISGSHIIYANIASDTIISNNTFDNFNYSGPRMRISDDSVFMNNKFLNGESKRETIGTFYQDAQYGLNGENDLKNYSECKTDGPYYQDLGNVFQPTPSNIQIRNFPEQEYCLSDRRVTPPMYAEGVQTGDMEYSLRWGEAEAKKGKITKYNVYVGVSDLGNSSRYYAEKYAKIATIPANEKRELTITKDMFEKTQLEDGKASRKTLKIDGKDVPLNLPDKIIPNYDSFFYIVAESSEGGKSARTDLRVQFNLDEKYKGREHYKMMRVETGDRLTNGINPPAEPDYTKLINTTIDENNIFTEKEYSIKPVQKEKITTNIDKLPVNTTFNIKNSELPGNVDIDENTGELIIDPHKDIKPGKYKIQVEIRYPDFTIDSVELSINIPQQDNEPTISTSTTPKNNNSSNTSKNTDNDMKNNEPTNTTTTNKPNSDENIKDNDNNNDNTINNGSSTVNSTIGNSTSSIRNNVNNNIDSNNHISTKSNENKKPNNILNNANNTDFKPIKPINNAIENNNNSENTTDISNNVKVDTGTPTTRIVSKIINIFQ